MRVQTDPRRVVELQPIAQGSVLAFVPVYAILLVVQQLLPKVFNVAYAVGAAVLLGPIFFQLVFG